MTIVVFSSLLICRRRSITSTVLRVSRSPVGSSRRRRSGSFASARAIVTRCCSPPESSDGKWLIRSWSPTSVSSLVTRARRSALLMPPRSDIGSSTFSNALIVAIRLNVWNTKPMRSRRRVARNESDTLESITCPKISRVPELCRSIVPSMFSNVVLPPPEGPRRITNSPFLTE
eukprot:Amastigsp_a843886_39.p3 type:complete len:174 gc:universal Amastigsp_a843886_39:286-807(+)